MKKYIAFAIVVVWAEAASAVTIDLVTIGNAGNAPDTRYEAAGLGSVGYIYQIGKYEITAEQYTEFLNAVAKSDPNGLYAPEMGNPSGSFGANIQQIGSSPNFSYSVAPDWANRPVYYISFWDAARFANWLHNGQPVGPQGPGTTEGGAYHDVGNQALFGRNAGAKFFIPTEGEWYKAAYHDKTAGLAASYFDYPTNSSTDPQNTLPDPGNHANFFDEFGSGTGQTIGGPYYRTEVGAFTNSASPYGTYDQAGNVVEWNEATRFASTRGLSGGSYSSKLNWLHASAWDVSDPASEYYNFGFRVAASAEVPEPRSFALMVAIVVIITLALRIH